MARVVVNVMPKAEIADPQGQAIAAALPSLGFTNITSIRQGKRFELELPDAPDADLVAQGEKIASALLANPVIETFSVTAETGG